jgi:hypothetical protein
MSVSAPLGLKLVFFAITLARTGDWSKTVLDSWESRCTIWPDPAPYPFELQKCWIVQGRELLSLAL